VKQLRNLGAKIQKSAQSARQADGSSPLQIVGETRLTLTRDGREFQFEGLVVENLDVEVLAGTPFMESNDISIGPAKHQVILGDGTTYVYGSQGRSLDRHAVCRAHVLRATPHTTTLWPGELIEMVLPNDMSSSYSVSHSNLAQLPQVQGHCNQVSSGPLPVSSVT